MVPEGEDDHMNRIASLSSHLDDIGRSDIADRMDLIMLRSAMPYRWERSPEMARKIADEGFVHVDREVDGLLGDDPGGIIWEVMEHHERFEDELSPKGWLELRHSKEYSDYHGDHVGDDWMVDVWKASRERYARKLFEIWSREHPDEVTMWVGDDPNKIDYYGASADAPESGVGWRKRDIKYRNNLLRFSPPEGTEQERFLEDENEDYALKVRVPPGTGRIPPEWFSVVPEDEWEKLRKKS